MSVSKHTIITRLGEKNSKQLYIYPRIRKFRSERASVKIQRGMIALFIAVKFYFHACLPSRPCQNFNYNSSMLFHVASLTFRQPDLTCHRRATIQFRGDFRCSCLRNSFNLLARRVIFLFPVQVVLEQGNKESGLFIWFQIPNRY